MMRSPSTAAFRAVPFLGLLAVLSACSFAGEGAPKPQNTCKIDTDCLEGTCDTTLGMCITPPEGPVTVVLEVSPDDRERPGTAVTQWVTPFQITDVTEKDIKLVAPITVIGNVTTATDGSAVPADVSFRKVTTVPGIPDVVVTTATATATAGPDTLPTSYGVTVASAETYEVDVQPTGDSAAIYPPIRETVVVPGNYDFFRHEFVYPATFTKVQGVLVDSAGKPQSNLRVRAYDTTTGRAISTRALSGLGNVPGAFELTFAQAPTNYTIRVSASTERPTYPTINVNPAYLLQDDNGHVPILVPNLAKVPFKGVVKLEGDVVVPGTSITFVASSISDPETGIEGTFQVMPPPSDDDGIFEVDLLPGTYEVVLAPQNTIDATNNRMKQGLVSEAAVLAKQITVEAGDTFKTPLAFTLPAQVEIMGDVRLADGNPMVGATLSATALGRLVSSTESRGELFNRSLPAGPATDAAGGFTLLLDPGSYDFVAQPPAGSGYPWLVRPGLRVTSKNDDWLTFDIPGATPITGIVKSATGSTVPGAEVRAWAILTEGAATRSVLIGRTVTAEDGTYTILLPSRF